MNNLCLIIGIFILTSCSSRLVGRNKGKIDPYFFNAGRDTSEIYQNSLKSKMLREDAGNFDSVISNKDRNQDDHCFENTDERIIYTLYDESAAHLEEQLQIHWDTKSRFQELGYDHSYTAKTFYSFFVRRYAHIEDYSIEKFNENKSEFMEKAESKDLRHVIIPHDAFEVARCKDQTARLEKSLQLIPIIGWYIVPFIFNGKEAISVRLRPRIKCPFLAGSSNTSPIDYDSFYCFRLPNVWNGSTDQFYFKLKQEISTQN